MFSKLDEDSATTAMEEKRIEQSVDWKERQAVALKDGRAGSETSSRPAISTSENAIVCNDLEFHFVGDDGLRLPGTLDCAQLCSYYLFVHQEATGHS